jgi:threonine dehydrogenase-like Zn-dependent dehydrogenase
MKSVSVNAMIAPVIATWPELIALLQTGRIKGDSPFTHRFSLSDGPEAYRMFDAQEDGVMKVMIDV